jgi:hypothetical protein
MVQGATQPPRKRLKPIAPSIHAMITRKQAKETTRLPNLRPGRTTANSDKPGPKKKRAKGAAGTRKNKNTKPPSNASAKDSRKRSRDSDGNHTSADKAMNPKRQRTDEIDDRSHLNTPLTVDSSTSSQTAPNTFAKDSRKRARRADENDASADESSSPKRQRTNGNDDSSHLNTPPTAGAPTSSQTAPSFLRQITRNELEKPTRTIYLRMSHRVPKRKELMEMTTAAT